MSILEVKNNLIKFCYEENLVLSGFVEITDTKNSYIAQVLHLEATRIGKVAIAKILFMHNENEISSYNGSIPALRAEVKPIDSSILLNTLEQHAPLNLGTLAQQNQRLITDLSALKDSPIICAEKFFATKVFLNNLAIQLQHSGNKVIVFDTVGIFGANKLKLGRDFKLPLNTSAINFIYENGFEDATAETKALIQSIFEELSEYSKTVPFIPFESFKAVVDAEFIRTKLIQLILLKNKIKQIGDMKIYGEFEQDFAAIVSKIQTDNTIVVDISGFDEGIQRECIKFIYSLLKDTNQEFYSFLPLSNKNSNKELLTEVHEAENVHTTIICGYDYKYLDLLKQTSKNMFMFTPLKQQKDFGGYNIYLQKLAEDEFIAYGKMTKFVPLIIKLHPIKSDEILIGQQTVQADYTAVPTQNAEEKVDNTIVEQFVNAITPESINLETPVVETVTETVTEETAEEEITALEEEEERAEVFEEITMNEEGEEEEEFAVNEEEEEEEFAVNEEEENPEATVEEIVTQEAVTNINEPAVEQEEVVALEEETIVEQDEVPTFEEEEEETEPQFASEEELKQALDEVPDLNEEEDEELSDDDLDMIENLSNNNEPETLAEDTVEQEETAVVEEAIVEQDEVTTFESEEEEIAPQPVTEPVPQVERPAVQENTNPKVPDYPSDIPEEDKIGTDTYQQGDRVIHDEFGEGVVEKLINYDDKILCSINFASVGRRLLNPEITEMRKI